MGVSEDCKGVVGEACFGLVLQDVARMATHVRNNADKTLFRDIS